MTRPGHSFSETAGQSRPPLLRRDTHPRHGPRGQSPGAPDDSCRAAGSGAGGHRPPDPDARTAPATPRTRRNGTLPCWSPTPVPPRRIAGRVGYRSWLLVVLVVVAVAQRRLGPSSSATTSTTDRALPSSAVQLRCWSRPTTRAAAYLPRPQLDRCRRSGHLRLRRSAERRAGRLDVPEPHREPIQGAAGAPTAWHLSTPARPAGRRP